MIRHVDADPEVLAPDELQAIANHAVERRYPAKAMVVAEGDRSDCPFIIMAGRAKAFVSHSRGTRPRPAACVPAEW